MTITSPTSGSSYSALTNVVALAGTASDSAGVVTVTWANTTNSTTGTASGTTSWSVASIPLAARTNTVVVTATDALGNTSTDTINVFACTTLSFPTGAAFAGGGAAAGHCYVRTATMRTKAQAEVDCNAMWTGVGKLASITSASENALVTPIVGDGSWIGANDIATEGTFSWPTGEPFSYTNWAAGQPAGGGAEDCVRMLAPVAPSPESKWSTASCNITPLPICEFAP